MNENPHLENYPLAEKQRERLRTPSGLPFQEITLEAALQGKIKMSDLRVTAEALEIQAQLAENAGRPQLAANFRRGRGRIDPAVSLPRNAGGRILQPLGAQRRCACQSERDDDSGGRMADESMHTRPPEVRSRCFVTVNVLHLAAELSTT